MGVSGLQKLIEDARNIDACSPKQPIGGRLIIDGNDLLHELYRDLHLDWAHGGQYSQLRRAITEFFTALHAKGVRPIVVLDGGGDEVLVEELVYRRNLSIREIPERSRGELAGAADTKHYLPILAGIVLRQTIANLKLRVPLCVADGKADPTIVQLANHYACPVLGCDGNYYIYNLAEGFAHYRHLDWRSKQGDPVTARVYRQRAFAQHFGLGDPALCLLLPALLGDGCDISLKYIYGAMRPYLNRDVPKCQAVLQYASLLSTYDVFVGRIDSLQNLDRRSKERVRNNCEKAKKLYVVTSRISQEELMQKPCRLPRDLLTVYRSGGFLPSLLTAVVVRRCPLHYQTGDLTCPPPPAMSGPIRQVTYGLLSGLSTTRPLTQVKEYYRNASPIGGQPEYVDHNLHVVSDRFHELSITAADSFSKEEKDPLIQELFSSVLRCPSDVIERFDTWEDSNWVLPVAATRFWATRLQAARRVPNLPQVVKALVLSFVNCHSQLETEVCESDWRHPDWEPTLHAFLQWQCVWYDVVGLNQVLQEPFDAPSPAALFDGPLALHYATHADCRAVDRAAQSLSPENKQLYDRLLEAVLP